MLDLNQYCAEDFSEKGKLDNCGNVIENTSLDYLLSKCTDFLNKKYLLQLNLENLGTQCFHLQKFHCKLTGEGIESYQKLKEAEKNMLKKFHLQFQMCLSQDHVTTNRILHHSK